MNRLSLRDTILFLAQAAPKIWVRRMLLWMILDRELYAHAEKVTVRSHVTPYIIHLSLLQEAGTPYSPQMEKAIRSKFAAEVAERLLKADEHEPVYDQPSVIEEDDIGSLDPGFFLLASDIDWENGNLRCDDLSGEFLRDSILFPWQDYVGSEFDMPTYEIEISSIYFDSRAVELLLPNCAIDVQQTGGEPAANATRRIGRPPKWNWEGAIAHLVATAQHPDGLPNGSGAQAKVEAMMADWFVAETGDSPATSQIRQRARSIMRLIEKPKT